MKGWRVEGREGRREGSVNGGKEEEMDGGTE